MKKILIIGYGDIFEQALSAWSEPSQQYEVASVELPQGEFFTWDFNLLAPYSPEQYECFVALGGHALSMARIKVMTDVKQLKYSVATYISPRASVAATAKIGEHCFIADGAVIGPSAIIRQNSYIGPRTVVGQGAKIGHSAWLEAGIILGARVQVGNNTTLGMGVTVAAECKIGNLCEITKVMDITQDLASRTYYHPMFEDVVRIYAA